ncbi:MAG: hypothetical protein JXA28_00730 [Bacteroidetes bacterium]|nr:hypothetical protein [Bacteroidota bacterium]
MIVLAIAAVFIFLPIRIPHAVSVYSRLLPQREWVLLRGSGGQIVSVLRNNLSGVVEDYSVTEPERGDAMQFLLASGVSDQRIIEKGDTIGWVLSPELARELTALEGALCVAEAGVTVARSGEKPELVAEAQSALAQAEAAYEEQLHLYARQEELHRRQIISEEEWQASGDRLAVLQAGMDVAKARLAAVSSGLKPEDIRQREQVVSALENEIAALRRRLSRFIHVAPFSGVVRSGFTLDTLLTLQDPTSMLLLLPLPVDDCTRLQTEKDISFRIPRTGLSGKARLLRIDEGVQYVQGQPVRLGIARILQADDGLRTGMIASASVSCYAMRAQEYLRRMWTQLFH